MFQSRIR